MVEFKNEDVKRQYEEKISKIESVLNAPVVDTKYLWNETVKNYATKIKQISRVINANSDDKNFTIEVGENIKKTFKDFLKTCSEHEFQIALVGTIKAGKSTLINALLNYELASTNVTPETAALTKFRKADEDYLEITYYKEYEWKQLWYSATHPNKEFQENQENDTEQVDTSNNVFVEDYNKLNADDAKKEWLNHTPEKFICDDREELKNKIAECTSSQSPKHYFVKEVTVGLKDCNLPRDVVLVDTPGLNDVVDFRSQITRGYILRANAVFACVKADKLEGNVLQTLYRVFDNSRKNVEKIYVIATQLDTLNNPKEDWKKQKIEWTKYLKGKNAYNDENLAWQNINSVSAYLYTLLREYKNKNISVGSELYYKGLLASLFKFGYFDPSVLDKEETFSEIQELTQIKVLSDRLETEILAKHDEWLLGDIESRYEKCLNLIRDVVENQKSKQQEMIETSQKSIEEIRAKRQEKEIGLKQARRDKDVLENYIGELKKATRKRIEEVKKAIKNIADKKGGE